MIQAKTGDKVSIQYIGTLDNGRIFDSTSEDKPLVFTIGSGEIFPALEQAVVGMRVGEARNLTIPAGEAFGPRRQENILTVTRDRFPAGREIRIGEKLQVEFGSAKQLVMRVMKVDDDTVTLDGNHALAGCDLTFALRLDRIG